MALSRSGATGRRAALTYARKRLGSLSASSNDSHATGARETRAQALTRVVLPEPAGADTRISGQTSPSSIRVSRRTRDTSSWCEVGIDSLVIKRGLNIIDSRRDLS